jgi:Protein of unknown function (DUF3592)
VITLSLDQYFHIIRCIIEATALAVAFVGGEFGRRKFQESLQKTAADWPSADGTIQWAKVERMPQSRRFVVNLTYTYFVGKYRAGDFAQEFRKEWEADAFAIRVRSRGIQIRYKKSDPEISIIDRGSMEQVFALPCASATL